MIRTYHQAVTLCPELFPILVQWDVVKRGGTLDEKDHGRTEYGIGTGNVETGVEVAEVEVATEVVLVEMAAGVAVGNANGVDSDLGLAVTPRVPFHPALDHGHDHGLFRGEHAYANVHVHECVTVNANALAGVATTDGSHAVGDACGADGAARETDETSGAGVRAHGSSRRYLLDHDRERAHDHDCDVGAVG
jgi:hypothetical protein